MDKAKELQTVGELIDHLEKLGRDRSLMIDVEGNTFFPTDEDINLWNPEDSDSPVAIMTFDWIRECK